MKTVREMKLLDFELFILLFVLGFENVLRTSIRPIIIRYLLILLEDTNH